MDCTGIGSTHIFWGSVFPTLAAALGSAGRQDWVWAVSHGLGKEHVLRKPLETERCRLSQELYQELYPQKQNVSSVLVSDFLH